MRPAMQTTEDRKILPPSEPVPDYVVSSECSAYDCEFVSLAKHLKVKLATGTWKILQSFSETALELNMFSGFP